MALVKVFFFFFFLSLVAGCLEIQQLKKLQAKFGKIKACVVEPSKELMGKYKNRVTRNDESVEDIGYEWHNKTFQEFIGATQKYHFISAIHSIYFLGGPEEAIKRMYSLLEQGGLILLLVTSGEALNKIKRNSKKKNIYIALTNKS